MGVIMSTGDLMKMVLIAEERRKSCRFAKRTMQDLTRMALFIIDDAKAFS